MRVALALVVVALVMVLVTDALSDGLFSKGRNNRRMSNQNRRGGFIPNRQKSKAAAIGAARRKNEVTFGGSKKVGTGGFQHNDGFQNNGFQKSGFDNDFFESKEEKSPRRFGKTSPPKGRGNNRGRKNSRSAGKGPKTTFTRVNRFGTDSSTKESCDKNGKCQIVTITKETKTI